MTDLPPPPALAALLGIDLDDPADADDTAALAELLVRRESCARCATSCRRPRRACAIPGDPRGTLDGMTDHPAPHNHFTPGQALPDPAAPFPGSPTTWGAPAQDYAGRPDGAAPWADVDPPAAVPPAVEPPALRVGWLTAARPDDAA